MKKQLKQTLLTGGLFVTLTASAGIAGPVNQAFADTVSAPQLSYADQLLQYRVHRVVEDAAWLSRQDVEDVSDALKNGDNLIEATSMKPDVLADRLALFVRQDLNDALAYGLVNENEVKAVSDKSAEQFKNLIQQKGYNEEQADQKKAYWAHLIQDRLDRVVYDAAALSDQEYEDIVNALENGRTLNSVVILSENNDTLKARLMDSMEQDFHNAMKIEPISAEQLAAYRAQASAAISRVITTPGFHKPAALKSKADLDALIQDRLDHIVDFSAALGNKDPNVLREQLAQGRTLITAAALEDNDLSAKLLEIIDQDLAAVKQSYSNTDEELAKARAQAEQRISVIVNSAGYDEGAVAVKKKVDLNALIQNRLDHIIDFSAALSNQEVDVLTEQLAQGRTLNSATALKDHDLGAKLLKIIDQDLENVKSTASNSSEEFAQARADAANRINTIINTNGYQQPKAAKPKADLNALIQSRMEHIVDFTAAFANQDPSDLRTQLQMGRSLNSAAALKDHDLFQKLMKMIDQDLAYVKSTSSNTDEELAQAREEAARLISKAIN